MNPTSDDPWFCLEHVWRLTNHRGIIQHARLAVPDPATGYTLDDNARALIVAVRHHRWSVDLSTLALGRCYLRFVVRALGGDGEQPHNFMGEDGRWEDARASDDALGRATWALGVTATEANDPDLRGEARRHLGRALDLTATIRAPRAVAFALLGIVPAASAGLCPARTGPLVAQLGERLLSAYRTYAGGDWCWFEPYLTYENARLPEALLAAFEAQGDPIARAVAREATDFLAAQVFPGDGALDLIGQDGWWVRDRPRAEFDQQPVDAGCMVELLVRAQRLLGGSRYGVLAARALAWFHGANRLGLALIDPATCGCRDGLQPGGLNENQGAESALAYLLARLALDTLDPGRGLLPPLAAGHAMAGMQSFKGNHGDATGVYGSFPSI